MLRDIGSEVKEIREKYASLMMRSETSELVAIGLRQADGYWRDHLEFKRFHPSSAVVMSRYYDALEWLENVEKELE